MACSCISWIIESTIKTLIPKVTQVNVVRRGTGFLISVRLAFIRLPTSSKRRLQHHRLFRLVSWLLDLELCHAECHVFEHVICNWTCDFVYDLRSVRFEIEKLFLGRFGIPHVFSWICQIFVGIWGPLEEKRKIYIKKKGTLWYHQGSSWVGRETPK